MQTLRLMLLVTLTGAVLACGQKGPLVLPDAQRPRKHIGISRPPAAKPVPAPTAPAAPADTIAPMSAPTGTDGSEAKPDTAPQP